jgi:hypothetical protein
LRGDQIRSIAGAQIERILAGEEPAYLGPAPGPPGPQDPGMERVVSHLTTAIGRAMAEGDPSESVALGRLAVDLEGPEADTGRAIAHLLDLADRHAGPPPPGRRFPRSAQFVMSALAVARTPGIALPPQG